MLLLAFYPELRNPYIHCPLLPCCWPSAGHFYDLVYHRTDSVNQVTFHCDTVITIRSTFSPHLNVNSSLCTQTENQGRFEEIKQGLHTQSITIYSKSVKGLRAQISNVLDLDSEHAQDGCITLSSIQYFLLCLHWSFTRRSTQYWSQMSNTISSFCQWQLHPIQSLPNNH